MSYSRRVARPVHQESALAPTIRRATILSAVLSGAALAYSLARHGDSGWTDWLALALLTHCVFAALHLRGSRRGVLVCALLAVAAALSLPGTLGFLALATAAQVVVHSASRDPRTWCWALAIGPASAACGLVFEPGAHWPLVFLAQLVLTLGAAPALGLAVRARWYDRRRPRELPRAGRARVAPATGWILLPLVLCGAGLASLALDALPSPLGASWKPRPRAEAPRRTPRDSDALERQALEGLFPDEVRLGEGAVDFSGRPVMELRVFRDGVELGPEVGGLYLRGLALDRIEDDRVRNRDPRLALVPDAYDGRLDGWVTLADATDVPTLDLVVRQRPMRIGVGGSIALFAPAPLLAVEAPGVLHDPDVMTALPVAPSDWFELRMRSRDWGADPPDLAGRAAQHPSDATRQLPRPSAELREVASLANAICAGATDDEARVLAVRDHFAAYDYELITRDLPGLRGVLALFDRGSGHCTHFASASVLLLRTQGVSARVATGYLATTYDQDAGAWLVSGRNGHAWIEVWFEGVGWVPFETTPMSRRERALEWSGGDGGLTSWAQDLATDLELWASSGGEARYLELAFDTALSFPAALWTSTRNHPLLAALWTLLALGAIAWRRRDRRRVERASRSVPRIEPSTRKLERRFLDVLAARGFRRLPHQTWREFLSAVRARDADLAERAAPIALAFEGFAYAEQAVDAAARSALSEQVAALAKLDATTA